MADTISALDTASTDELIAALVARHRATLGQACGQLESNGQVLHAAMGLTQEIAQRVASALSNEANSYVRQHPTYAPNPLRSPFDFGPPFGFGPFGRG